MSAGAPKPPPQGPVHAHDRRLGLGRRRAVRREVRGLPDAAGARQVPLTAGLRAGRDGDDRRARDGGDHRAAADAGPGARARADAPDARHRLHAVAAARRADRDGADRPVLADGALLRGAPHPGAVLRPGVRAGAARAGQPGPRDADPGAGLPPGVPDDRRRTGLDAGGGLGRGDRDDELLGHRDRHPAGAGDARRAVLRLLPAPAAPEPRRVAAVRRHGRLEQRLAGVLRDELADGVASSSAGSATPPRSASTRWRRPSWRCRSRRS